MQILIIFAEFYSLLTMSSFSRKILDDTPTIENPVTIHMSGINSTLMRHLLVFLYSGQAYIEVCIFLKPTLHDFFTFILTISNTNILLFPVG